MIPGPTGAKAVYQSGQPNLITIGSGWNYKNKAKWAKDDELFRHFEAKNFISLSHDFKCVMIAGLIDIQTTSCISSYSIP